MTNADAALGLAGYLQCRLPTLSTSLGLGYADVGYNPYPIVHAATRAYQAMSNVLGMLTWLC